MPAARQHAWRVLGAYLAPIIGWRGLFVIGLMPALITLLIRAWVPESPRWLIRGCVVEAREALAWALQTDPSRITLPASVPARDTPRLVNCSATRAA